MLIIFKHICLSLIEHDKSVQFQTGHTSADKLITAEVQLKSIISK